MAKFEIKPTGQFKKDLKRYKYDQGKLDDLQKVLNCLEETGVFQRTTSHTHFSEITRVFLNVMCRKIFFSFGLTRKNLSSS